MNREDMFRRVADALLSGKQDKPEDVVMFNLGRGLRTKSEEAADRGLAKLKEAILT